MITDAKNFDVSKLVFLKPKEIVSTNHNVSFKRIPIKVMQNMNLRPLLIATEKCYSWGIQKDQSYKLPITLFDICPTEEQKTFIDTFKKIVEACKKHCVENGLENVEKMGSCLFVKNESHPTLYAKIPLCNDKITTNFYEMQDVADHNESGKEEPEPKSLVGQKMIVKALLRFDNIYVSVNCISLQVRTEEVNFRRIKSETRKRKRIMSNAVAEPGKKSLS